MKQKTSVTKKEFDTVRAFRDIKEKKSLMLADMSFDQIKAYLKKRSEDFQQQFASETT